MLAIPLSAWVTVTPERLFSSAFSRRGARGALIYIRACFRSLMERPVPRSKKAKRGFLVGALVFVAAFAAACARDAPQDYLNDPVGQSAKKADALWDLTFAVAVVIFVLVEGALVYALFRFRHREGREAAQFHGNTKLEIALTLIPTLILAAIAVPTLTTIFTLAAREEGALEVEVVGRQFWWEYRYSDSGVVTANELHIPTGTPVRLAVEGDPNDVIHSFWVPRLAPKQDVVPGRTNYINLQTDRPGTYLGQCAEFCGLSHANMRLRVIAQEPTAFAAWLAEQQRPAARPAAGSDAAEGRQLFVEGACAGCHTVEGTPAQGTLGPDLTHFASRSTFAGAMFDNDEESLRRWLADPPGVKPGAKMPDLGLSEQDIEKLIAFLQTLR